MEIIMKKLRVAALQTQVFEDKKNTLIHLEEMLCRAMEMAEADPSIDGLDLVTVGEMFTCPYVTSNFPLYAEEEGGPSYSFCSNLASRFGIYLSAGSMPERDPEGHVYNTAYVFDPEGKQIARHRKMHLFDINVEGGQQFRESDTLTAGNEIVTFDTKFCRMGLCVCYDMRFPELARIMALDGARVILVPAAFNLTTGPAHWEIMFRGRAIENEVFVIGTSPARNPDGPYVAWGHSMAVSPWGKVLYELDEKEGIALAALDLDEVTRMRQELPFFNQRRTDLYELRRKK
ncbi:MAG: carbon-nitrogen hydrolase family protein [Eubacterium sp.]|nr:carbon-nitrogen hydrolase family protein [Eubacterium sp.]